MCYIVVHYSFLGGTGNVAKLGLALCQTFYSPPHHVQSLERCLELPQFGETTYTKACYSRTTKGGSGRAAQV